MSTSSSSKPSLPARMLFRGSSSTLSAPEVSSVSATATTSCLSPDPISPESSSTTISRSRTESISSAPSLLLSKGKSPLSLLSKDTSTTTPAPSISGPSTSISTSATTTTAATTIVNSHQTPHLPQPHLHSSGPPAHPTRQNPQASPPVTAPDERAVTEARNALLATLENHFNREITPRAALLHQNKAAIEKQQNDLVKATEGLKKENDKMAKMVDGYSKQVMEVGDVQNWAEMLEREFLILEDTLRRVREGNSSDEGSYSESYTGSDWSGSQDGDGREHTRPEEVPLPPSP